MLFTLSNAVEHDRGWVARKMGLFDIFKANDDGDQQEYAKMLRRISPRLLLLNDMAIRRICLGANKPIPWDLW